MTYYYDSQVAHNDKVMGVKIKDNPDGFPYEFLRWKIWRIASDTTSLIYHDEKKNSFSKFSMGTHFFHFIEPDFIFLSLRRLPQLFHRPFEGNNL